MVGKLNKLTQPLHQRYVVTGLSIYLFELVVIVVAQRLGASPIVAVGISFWLGLIVSFILQKTVTFRDTRTHHKILIPQTMAFALLVLFNFGFTILVTKLLSPTVPAVISRTIALGITTIWNLYLYKKHIFVLPGINQKNV